jgi:hypothetical protein
MLFDTMKDKKSFLDGKCPICQSYAVDAVNFKAKTSI